MNSSTSSHNNCRYCAPEQYQASHSFPVDVFAFGIMAWEILSGKRLAKEMMGPTAMPFVWKTQLAYTFTAVIIS